MSASRTIIILAVVALPLMLAGYMAGRAAPAPDPDQKMKASFEALQKKLPGLVKEWAKKEIGEWVTLKQVKVKIKLARFTSPFEAKITCFITMKVDDEFKFDVPQYVSFYLRYFDGKWTTIRADSGSKMGEIVGSLMLAIDLASDK